MEIKKELVKNLLTQHNLEIEKQKNKQYQYNQKLKDIDTEISDKIKLQENYKNQKIILDERRILMKNKLNSYQYNLDRTPDLESNILRIQKKLNILRKDKLILEEKLEKLNNNNELEINKFIIGKKNEINEYLNIQNQLNKNYQINQQKINLQQVKFKEENLCLQIELETLQLEFKLNGNLRLQNRNTNIQNIIQFQTTQNLLIKDINVLEKDLIDNTKSLEQYIIFRKNNYQNLLKKNNIIMKNKLNPNKLKNVYYECRNSQEQHQITTQKQIKKMKDFIKIIEFSLIQKKLELSKMKTRQKNKSKQHNNTLQKIKQIRSTISKLNFDLKILLIKKDSYTKQYQKKYKNIENKIYTLEEEIENNSLKNREFREKVKEILNLGIKIKLAKEDENYYQNNIKNIKIRNTKLIHHFQDNLKQIDIEIKNIDKNINNLEKKKILLRDKKNFLKIKNKTSQEKYIKEKNQLLIQELSSLSNLIT